MQLHSIHPGDVILTRNEHESDNSSPGYWNHASLYVGGHEIVEAQIKPNKVILSDLAEFWNRYPEILVLRITNISHCDVLITARKIVGSPYRKIASLFRFLRRSDRGENCVSVIRRSFTKTLEYDPGWKIPDDIMKDNLFYIVGTKEGIF